MDPRYIDHHDLVRMTDVGGDVWFCTSGSDWNSRKCLATSADSSAGKSRRSTEPSPNSVIGTEQAEYSRRLQE